MEYIIQPRNPEALGQLPRLRDCYDAYQEAGGDRLTISDELDGTILLSMTKMNRYADERYGFFLYRQSHGETELLEYHFSNMARPEIIDALCAIVEERTPYYEQNNLLCNRQ